MFIEAHGWVAEYQSSDPKYPGNTEDVVFWTKSDDGYVYGLVLASNGKLRSAETYGNFVGYKQRYNSDWIVFPERMWLHMNLVGVDPTVAIPVIGVRLSDHNEDRYWFEGDDYPGDNHGTLSGLIANSWLAREPHVGDWEDATLITIANTMDNEFWTLIEQARVARKVSA